MVNFQVNSGLELRALRLCISGGILLQDFYQNHSKLFCFFNQTIKIAQLTIAVFVSLCKHLLNLQMKTLN